MPAVSCEGLPTMEFYRQQIVLGLKDYARRCGFKQAVVGSSGGIDSALTLALAVHALGASNVGGITMPSRFSSEDIRLDELARARYGQLRQESLPDLPQAVHLIC